MIRITLIIISLLLFLQLYLQHQLPSMLAWFYVCINLCTFCVYVFDKSAARQNRWRVRESYLHLLAILGGWWGAIVAQQFIRHKSVKKPFLMIFSFTVIANITMLIVFLYNLHTVKLL